MSIFQALDKRQRQGTETSASILVPAGITKVTITGDLDAAKLADPTNVLRFGIERSVDGGTTWSTLVIVDWQGGQRDRAGNFVPPNASITVVAGERLRAWLDMPVRQQLGAIIETS